GSYGFPESHAASFALLVYVSSWIKYYYPDVFAAALLNSQPMGFYQPAQLIIDARKHGITVLPVDINYSEWDNTLEGEFGAVPHQLRVGRRQGKRLKAENVEKRIQRRHKPYPRVAEVAVAGSSFTLERLGDGDGFRSIGLARRQALW